MTLDPRTPVIVGVAQVSQQPVADALQDSADPIGLMTRAVREAGVDTGADPADVLSSLDTIAVVGGLWRYENPGALIASDLELSQPPRSILTTFGGNLPIHSAHALAEMIRSGEIEMAVLAGGECNQTRRQLAKQGRNPPRRDESGIEDSGQVEMWGPPLDMGDPVATERGGQVPRNTYAVLDSAIRSRREESLDEARDRAAELWAGYAAVAAENPDATDRQGLDASAIRTPTKRNRMVSWPYTKAMCANNDVDHAAAIILCSSARADALGVPTRQRVYPRLCVESTDTTSLLERPSLSHAPGLTAAAATLVEALGSVEAIDHAELYSCFPSIVTMTTEALGMDPTRPLTVTGGLAFAGAPLNFAAGQGLVGMVKKLRNDPGSIGVVQGNGGHAAKHAFGVYSSAAPAEPHTVIDLGSLGTPADVADPDRAGDARLCGVTVEYDHDGPVRAVAVVEFDDGSRTWAVSEDEAVMRLVTEQETVGHRVRVAAGIMTDPLQ